MKKVVVYLRISTKDQSNFSISGQREMIESYCIRQQYQIFSEFVDEGQSAKNFDRPDWNKLIAFIKKNHREVDYLIVAKYDRFSRQTREALQMIEDLEHKYDIKIISVAEPIHVRPDSPFFFQIRTQILTNAQVEWMIIRDRTRFGNHYAAKAGRFTSTAPFGYRNARDEKNKPILILEEAKALVVKRMYEMLFQGAPIKEITLEAKRMGLPNKGHSAVKYMLENPVYGGMVKIPDYNDEVGGLGKGLHQGVIDQATWFRAQEIINPRAQAHTVLNEEVPLRGVVKCFCGRTLTAGNSKGRKKYYWYYRCESHIKINLPGRTLHAQMDELISHLSLPEQHLNYLKQAIVEQLQNFTQESDSILQEKKRELQGLNKKLENVEEKYINDDLDRDTFKKFKDRYQKEIAITQQYILDYGKPTQELQWLFEENLPKLSNLSYLYNKADLHGKQAFLRQVFKSNLYYQDGCYRTSTILPMFASKALLLKEKGLLIIEQAPSEFEFSNGCAPDRT